MENILKFLEKYIGKENTDEVKKKLIEEIKTEICKVVSEVVCNDGELYGKTLSPSELVEYLNNRYDDENNKVI